MPTPIFIISLRDNHDRRAPVVKALAKEGIEPHIFPAVDGRATIPAELEAVINRHAAFLNMRREVSNPEWGCALSHRGVYKEIITKNLHGAIILEDDAILNSGFFEFMKKRAYREYNFVHLYYEKARVYRARIGCTGRYDKFRIERLIFNASTAAGYYISRDAAKYILKKSTPLCLTADWPCNLRPLRPVITVPNIVIAPAAKSVHQSTLEGARSKSRKMTEQAGRSLGERVIRNPVPWFYRFGPRWISKFVFGSQ